MRQIEDTQNNRNSVDSTNEKQRLSNERMVKLAQNARLKLRALTQQYNHDYQKQVSTRESPPVTPVGVLSNMPLGLVRGLDELEPEVGFHFNGHGMVKGTWEQQLKSLDHLLSEGASADRTLYEMPLRGCEAYAGAFGAERPFDTGGFIVVSAPGNTIAKGGIKYVLVNDHFFDAITELQAAYPQVTFIRADKMAVELPQILEVSLPDVYSRAMARVLKPEATAPISSDKNSHKTVIPPVPSVSAGGETDIW
jgi:hypothetical protein